MYLMLYSFICSQLLVCDGKKDCRQYQDARPDQDTDENQYYCGNIN